MITPVHVRTADSRSVSADDFPVLPCTLADSIDFLSRFRSVSADSRPRLISGAGPRHTFVSGAGSRPTFVSGAGPRPTFVSDAGSRLTFVSDAGPRPTFVSDAGPRPTFVSGAGPRPTFVSDAGSRPTFVSGAGSRPTFVSGAGLVFNDSMSVATNSFDIYLYIQTLFQMHLLLVVSEFHRHENQTNVSLVPFQIGGGPQAVVYLEASTPLHIKEVMSILNDPDMDKVSNIPPQHPRGGQVFLISDGGDQAKQND